MAVLFEIYDLQGNLCANWKEGEAADLSLGDGSYFLVKLSPHHTQFKAEVSALSVRDAQLVDADLSQFSFQATVKKYKDGFPEEVLVGSEDIAATGLDEAVRLWKETLDSAGQTSQFFDMCPFTLSWMGKNTTFDMEWLCDAYNFNQVLALWAMTNHDVVKKDDVEKLRQAIINRVGISRKTQASFGISEKAKAAAERLRRTNAPRARLRKEPAKKDVQSANAVKVMFSGRTPGAVSVAHFDCINVVPQHPTKECIQIGIQSRGDEPERAYIRDGILYGMFPDVSFNIWDEAGKESGFASAAGRAELLRDAMVDEVVVELYDAQGNKLPEPLVITGITLRVFSGETSFETLTKEAHVFCD